MPLAITGFNSLRQAPFRLCRALWETLPHPVRRTPAMFRAGRYIYRQFTRHTGKFQSHYTQFMRNPPLLSTIATLASHYPRSSHLKIASIGCSTGAELYSVLYTIKSLRSDLHITAQGADISDAVVEAARRGVYFPDVPAAEGGLYAAGRAEVAGADVPSLVKLLEPLADGSLRVRDWVRESVTWRTADATDDKLPELFEPQDFLLANNFMGPMDDHLAERCLRNMVRLVARDGYLVVDGIDLDVKTRVLTEFGFRPVLMNQEEIWEVEGLKTGWPWLRWGREPIDRSEADWARRYSVIFRRDDH